MTASAFNYYLYVGEGKKRSENLKKRYSKKKNNLKRKSASGPGLADVEAAKRDLKEYGFLSWPEKYLQLSETKTNLRSFRLDDFESGSTDHSDPDDTESLNIELDLNRASKKKKKWKLPQFVPKYPMIKQIQTVATQKKIWNCSTSWIVCFTKYWKCFCCKRAACIL